MEKKKKEGVISWCLNVCDISTFSNSFWATVRTVESNNPLTGVFICFRGQRPDLLLRKCLKVKLSQVQREIQLIALGLTSMRTATLEISSCCFRVSRVVLKRWSLECCKTVPLFLVKVVSKVPLEPSSCIHPTTNIYLAPTFHVPDTILPWKLCLNSLLTGLKLPNIKWSYFFSPPC